VGIVFVLDDRIRAAIGLTFSEKPSWLAFLTEVMPKSVTQPKKFLELCSRPDAKSIKVKKLKEDVTKFKLRTTKYLYTLTVKQSKIVKLVTDAIPQNLEVIYIGKQEAK
jgi:large subunit ribosomal protein L38e